MPWRMMRNIKGKERTTPEPDRALNSKVKDCIPPESDRHIHMEGDWNEKSVAQAVGADVRCRRSPNSAKIAGDCDMTLESGGMADSEVLSSSKKVEKTKMRVGSKAGCTVPKARREPNRLVGSTKVTGRFLMINVANTARKGPRTQAERLSRQRLCGELHSEITADYKEKLILLQSYPEMAAGIAILGLPSMTIPDLFMPQKIGEEALFSPTGVKAPRELPWSGNVNLGFTDLSQLPLRDPRIQTL
ncbi:hypothetical protein DFH09DRAFT_1080746 [Mycena vulgaris]|nr:hypothetical protein DFH09DRAFT_1080746 [Mycena vulgaris]